MNLKEWKHVLRVSDMWQMDELKDTSILHMAGLFNEDAAALQLRLALDMDIEKWKMPSLRKLVLRGDPLSAEELEILGFTTSAKVLRIRELDIALQSGLLRRQMPTSLANDLILQMVDPTRPRTVVV
jgi:hypothetical protein